FVAFLSWYLKPPNVNAAFLADFFAAPVNAREAIIEKYSQDVPYKTMANLLDVQNKLCHSEAHPLGRVIFRDTQSVSESLRMCGNTCSFGCFHGVLMEMFGAKSDYFGASVDDAQTEKEALQNISKAADTFCLRSDIKNIIWPVECVHGL